MPPNFFQAVNSAPVEQSETKVAAPPTAEETQAPDTAPGQVAAFAEASAEAPASDEGEVVVYYPGISD